MAFSYFEPDTPLFLGCDKRRCIHESLELPNVFDVVPDDGGTVHTFLHKYFSAQVFIYVISEVITYN